MQVRHLNVSLTKEFGAILWCSIAPSFRARSCFPVAFTQQHATVGVCSLVRTYTHGRVSNEEIIDCDALTMWVGTHSAGIHTSCGSGQRSIKCSQASSSQHYWNNAFCLLKFFRSKRRARNSISKICIIDDGFLKTEPGDFGWLEILATTEQLEPESRLSQMETPFFEKLHAERWAQVHCKQNFAYLAHFHCLSLDSHHRMSGSPCHPCAHQQRWMLQPPPSACSRPLWLQ